MDSRISAVALDRWIAEAPGSSISKVSIAKFVDEAKSSGEIKPATGRAIRITRVTELTSKSRAGIWKAVKENPEFPKPYKLSEGVTVWDEGEVLAFLEKCKAARVVQ